MTTIRVAQRRRFATIAREAINDKRISFRARGVLAWVLDKPDDWTTSAEAISDEGTEGRDAIRTALSELEKFGYLSRVKRQVEGGHWSTDWVMREVPTEDGIPVIGNPDVGLPGVGSPGPLPETDTKTETETPRAEPLPLDDVLDAEFARWWSAYPRKIARKDARKAYEKCRRDGATAVDLLRAAVAYAETREGEPEQYTKHATTFLRNDRWRDSLPGPGDEDDEWESHPLRRLPV